MQRQPSFTFPQADWCPAAATLEEYTLTPSSIPFLLLGMMIYAMEKPFGQLRSAISPAASSLRGQNAGGGGEERKPQDCTGTVQ